MILTVIPVQNPTVILKMVLILRLRSVQLGYTFPQTWFKGAIQHARVYINAENLFTITSYSGYSPDVNADNANYRGFDNFIYPTNRTFMLGLNVTF